MNTEQLDYIVKLTNECRKRAVWHPDFFATESSRKTWWWRTKTLRMYRQSRIMPPPSYLAYIEGELEDAALVAMPQAAYEAADAGLSEVRK